MKPKYEKPVAFPLGEAAKGSGQCNAGSGVMPGSLMPGGSSCGSGSGANPYCTGGTGATDNHCGYGSGGYVSAGCVPGYSPHCATGEFVAW